MFKFGRLSKARLIGVDSRLVEIAERAIQITVIDFGIPRHGGLRTAAEQHWLFVDEVSKADGYQNPSYHQSGRALDFFAYVEDSASWKPEHLALIACALLQAAAELGYPLKWGGLWGGGPYRDGFTDMPHVELIC